VSYRFWVAALLLLDAGVAAAELIEIDLQTPDDRLVVHDTVTNLDWLKHAHTHAATGTSTPTMNEVLQALPGIGGGPWRYATTAEVQDLFDRHAVATSCADTSTGSVGSIEVSNEEIEARIEKITEGSGEKAEEIRTYFRHPERRRSLEGDMIDEKVLEFLRESADVKAA